MRVAFAGKPGAGKDTACAHYSNALLIRIAAPVYRIVAAHQREHGLELRKDRDLLRQVAQSGRDMCGDAIWSRAAERDILDAVERGWTDDIVVPDLRFPCELEMLRRNGFRVVRIVRPGVHDEHPTECGLDSYDIETVTNDSSIDDLWAKLDALFGRGACRLGGTIN